MGGSCSNKAPAQYCKDKTIKEGKGVGSSYKDHAPCHLKGLRAWVRFGVVCQVVVCCDRNCNPKPESCSLTHWAELRPTPWKLLAGWSWLQVINVVGSLCIPRQVSSTFASDSFMKNSLWVKILKLLMCNGESYLPHCGCC